MRRTWLMLAVCALLIGGFGCGVSESEDTPEPISQISDPGLEHARQLEAAGKPLTGKQKRILDDARAEGAIE